MKKITFFLATAVCLVQMSCTTPKNAQEKATEITGLLDKQQYTFVAQSVFPTEDSRFNMHTLFPNSSNLYQLSSRYDVRVTADSVVAYLPFYGRAYTAPMDPSKGGIKFTSTKFTYTSKRSKKGLYEIQIRPTDNREVQTIYVTVSPSGSASLQVINVNKSPISFNGIIEPNQ